MPQNRKFYHTIIIITSITFLLFCLCMCITLPVVSCVISALLPCGEIKFIISKQFDLVKQSKTKVDLGPYGLRLRGR